MLIVSVYCIPVAVGLKQMLEKVYSCMSIKWCRGQWGSVINPQPFTIVTRMTTASTDGGIQTDPNRNDESSWKVIWKLPTVSSSVFSPEKCFFTVTCLGLQHSIPTHFFLPLGLSLCQFKKSWSQVESNCSSAKCECVKVSLQCCNTPWSTSAYTHRVPAGVNQLTELIYIIVETPQISVMIAGTAPLLKPHHLAVHSRADSRISW